MESERQLDRGAGGGNVQWCWQRVVGPRARAFLVTSSTCGHFMCSKVTFSFVVWVLKISQSVCRCSSCTWRKLGAITMHNDRTSVGEVLQCSVCWFG